VVAAVLALAGCTVPKVREPESVAIKTETFTPAYSSFNAQVLSDAAKLDYSFATSLTGEQETMTRLHSTYVQQLGSESLNVGDAVSATGMWGSAVRYGGMQFGTRTKVRADVIDSSRLASTGIAVLPTVADALFASVGAGLQGQSLAVKGSPARSGSNPWNLVARDALGHSQSISGPMIAGTELVSGGCGDFSVGLGRVRQDYAISSNDYGPMFANTTVTCGAPLGFTVQGHGEYLADEVTALGLGVARQVGPLGTASLSLASSATPAGEQGWLAKVGFDHRNALFNVMLRSRIQSREFRDVASLAVGDPVMQRDLASVGVKTSEGTNLSLAYATQVTFSRERTNLIALRQSMGLGRGSLSMSAGHSLEDNFGSSLYISYQLPLGTLRRLRSPVQEFELDLPRLMLPN
jgi:outer membrane usher protein